jgi:DNA-binding transcriptional ArsR family regulator
MSWTGHLAAVLVPSGIPHRRKSRSRDQGKSIQNRKWAVDIRHTTHYRMVVDKLDTTFAALSDPTRRAMIERLSHGPASVHGLTEPFALSQQMISKHIAYLVRARIVIKTKRGRESVCTLRPEAIKTVSDWAIRYRRFWEESFDKLEVVVNQMKKEEERDDRKHGKRS